jgi:DNA-binding CsgD family transcriptional regulator/tetratricopeptide (TPR) repeat protein
MIGGRRGARGRMTLWGRREQCATLDALLADARAGRSRALVVRGEPGIGKTALLNYAADTAADFQVARAEGVESEMELPFAALHQLCGRMLSRLDRLPDPQRDALAVAFGLRSGNAPDRFLVGLAVLGLLSEAAAEQPLLCLIDDTQWLDQASAQALALAARRLDTESVAVIFGTRDLADTGDLAGIPQLVLAGLPDADGRALLAAAIPGRLDERVRDRIVAESAGNPLALLELPRGVTAAQLAGGFGVAGPLPLTGRIEQSFLRQVAPLPEPTRRLLLLAAVEPLGDPVLLWHAADRLGIAIEAADAAESDGLLQLGARVTFRHPLVRSAIYSSAAPQERREAHRALAAATDPQLDPDRRAWHLAQGAAGPDEVIASELERSAGRAQARGGLAAAAAFLERSAALTLEPAARGARALAAAEAKHEAGALDATLRLLTEAEGAPLDELQRARAERLRAQIALVQDRNSDAQPLLLSAARRLESLDPALARESYLDALAAAFYVGGRDALLELAHTLGATAPAQPRAVELFLTGYARLLSEGFPAGTDLLQRALIAYRSEPLSGAGELRGLWYASGIAKFLWDDASWDVLSARHVQLARDAGALTALPLALDDQADFYVQAGELAAAAALLEEGIAITEVTRGVPQISSGLRLAAWRDTESSARERIEGALREATRTGLKQVIPFAEYANAVLNNGLGRYQAALGAAQRSCDHHPTKGFGRVWSELVEAAARSGERERAAAALERIVEPTRTSGSDWGLGVEARSRALLCEAQQAEDLYQEAIDRLGRTRMRTDLARAHLVYGEWLRRENRRIDAREQLRTAHQMFVFMGADSFAERAARELLATGERVRKRTTDAPARLTARETQIARLASHGLSNPEIAAQLFMSRRTVEYHLHKIFSKLAVSSRNQLHLALAGRRAEGSR